MSRAHTGTNRLAKIIYLMPVLGCAIDQMSTRIGLTNHNLFEKNLLTSYLLVERIWLYVDIIVVIIVVLVSYFLIKHWGFKHKQVIFFFPFTYGLLKLVTGFLNIYLYITA